MAIFTRYLVAFIDEFGSVLSEVGQTATIVAAVVGSLLWVALQLIFRPVENRSGSGKPGRGATPPRDSDPNTQPVGLQATKQISIVSSFHLNRKSSQTHIHGPGWGSTDEAVWSNRQVEKNCTVPCIKCRATWAERCCRYVMCTPCCLNSKSRVCSYHQSQRGNSETFHTPAIPTTSRSPTLVDLSYSNLQQCPDRVGYIGVQLVTLNLSNNSLHTLPEEIGCLLGLQELLLQKNYLKFLPTIVGHLTNLKELDLAFNQLELLPESLGNLRKLTHLRLNNNHIKTLPGSIGQLAELRELNVSYNKILCLPRKISSLTNLAELYVRHCHLSEVPKEVGSLVRLKELDVAHNKITFLPKSISSCSSMEKLWLSYNKLSRLPDDLGRLHLLKELFVEQNRLCIFPESILSLTLFVLKVAGNPLLDSEGKVATHSKLRPWWVRVDSEQSRDLPPSVTKTCPTLVDLAESKILSDDLPWRKENLPTNLKERLADARYCAFCDRPLVTKRIHNVSFSLNKFNVPFLPLERHSCLGPYTSQKDKILHIPKVEESPQ